MKEYVISLIDINTDCECSWIITNDDVLMNFESWKIDNPGPYSFIVVTSEEYKDKKLNELHKNK